MIDGPYKGWKPTPEDWYRIKFGRVLYVDKDGLSSSMGVDRSGHPKFQTNDKYNQDGSIPTSEPHRETGPMGWPTESGGSETLRQMFEAGALGGYREIQPEDLSLADSFVNSSSSSDRSVTTSPLGSSGSGETNGRNGVDRISRGINGARIMGDSSSVLPMELMIYNDLMMDIEGTARFLGHEFQNSVLFGPTPTLSSSPPGLYPGQNIWQQSPNTMYGCVSSFSPFHSSQMLRIVIGSGNIRCMIIFSTRYPNRPQHRIRESERAGSIPEAQSRFYVGM